MSLSHLTEGDLVRLRLTGELDVSTVGTLSHLVDELIDAGRDKLLVDLTELTFCDSAGMAAFVRGDNEASARGGWLRLTGASGRVARVLRISGLAEILSFVALAGAAAARPKPQASPAPTGKTPRVTPTPVGGP